MTYQVTLYNHLRQGWTILFAFSLLFLLPAYFYFIFGSESLGFAVKAAVIAFLLVFIPFLIIHTKYWLTTRGKMLSIDTRSKSFSVKQGNELFEYSFADIESVRTVVSLAKKRQQFRWFPWDNYCYSVIRVAGDREFLITSLLVPELKWPIKMPKESISSDIFCWP